MKYDDPYSRDSKEYNRLVEELYSQFSNVTLDPEYASMIQTNMASLLIRLARYKFAAKMLNKGDTVLEVGCSTGLGTIFLGQYCKKVTGLEVKRDDIERARKLNQRDNVSFENIDLFEYPLSNQFNAAVSLDAIEHMDEPTGERFVAKIAKHLLPDGMLVLGTPSWYIRDYQNALSKAAHIKMYKQEELVALLDKYFTRTVAFSMNDEIVHTGHPKMAWYHIVLAFVPRR